MARYITSDMSSRDNKTKPSDIPEWRLTYGRVTPTNLPDVNDVTIDPNLELQGYAHARQGAEQAQQQLATTYQHPDNGQPRDNTDVLRSEGVSSWLKANYPKDDYGQRIKDMRRQKAISTFGNLATALGQAAALGIGARQFDKIQDKSASYDEYIQKLKDAQLNYNLNKTNAMYTALNADAQRRAAADEADKARKFNADEADKTRAYNAALARQNAEIEANKDAYKMAFEAAENEKNRQNRTQNAVIRASSSGSGDNKYYGSLPVEGKIESFKSQADYDRAVIAEAKRLNIKTSMLEGIQGVDEHERERVIREIAGEIQRRYKDEQKTKGAKSTEADKSKTIDVNTIFNTDEE